ncbi:MAG: hypothetical protein AAFW75_23525 [Cyanobacteria bacterium J06636_16]
MQKESIDQLFQQHRELDASFQNATRLDHEGFRAFSEAYKSAREMIERDIEDKQRKFSSLYVDQVVQLLKRINNERDNLQALSE